jgi:hypothetical protein
VVQPFKRRVHENRYLGQTATGIGVRDTQRILGGCVLKVEEAINGVRVVASLFGLGVDIGARIEGQGEDFGAGTLIARVCDRSGYRTWSPDYPRTTASIRRPAGSLPSWAG